MFPYNESEWEFISVIKDNRYKIKMTVEDLNEEDSSEDLPATPDAEPVDRHKKSVEKIKESLEA